MERAARGRARRVYARTRAGRGEGVTDRPVKWTGSPGSDRSWGSLESVRDVAQDGDQHRRVADIRGEKHDEVGRPRRDGHRQAAGGAEAARFGSLIVGRRAVVPMIGRRMRA